jgi:hypothetical protein
VPHLEPTFAEDFRVDRDPRTLALDFWSYLNARQANLGWGERDHRLWSHLELALADVKPVLLDPRPERFRPFLEALVGLWRSPAPVPATPPGADDEARQVRRELADMVDDALHGEHATRGVPAAPGRAVVMSGTEK